MFCDSFEQQHLAGAEALVAEVDSEADRCHTPSFAHLLASSDTLLICAITSSPSCRLSFALERRLMRALNWPAPSGRPSRSPVSLKPMGSILRMWTGTALRMLESCARWRAMETSPAAIRTRTESPGERLSASR